MRVQSLGQKDPLEKKMVTHSSILAWKTPWTEEFGGLQSMRLQRIGNDLSTEYTGMHQIKHSPSQAFVFQRTLVVL